MLYIYIYMVYSNNKWRKRRTKQIGGNFEETERRKLLPCSLLGSWEIFCCNGNFLEFLTSYRRGGKEEEERNGKNIVVALPVDKTIFFYWGWKWLGKNKKTSRKENVVKKIEIKFMEFNISPKMILVVHCRCQMITWFWISY